MTQDAEAVPRLKGQRKRHCSMRLKPTDRRPANRLALALHTRSCCEICLLHSRIYSSRQYTRPLLLLTPSFTSLPFALPHVRRSCAQPSAFRNYRIIAYRPHSACCRIPRIFRQGCMSLILLRLDSCILSSPQVSSIVLLQEVQTLIYRTIQSAITMAAQQKRKQSSLPAGEFLSHVKTMCRSTSSIDALPRIQRGPQQGPHAPLRGELAQAPRANP